MILYRWQGLATNFGDELNTILWPRLLPGFFDENPAIRLLGVGSVLDRRHPPDVVKLVAGSGYGGYERRPKLDRNWIIHWVRGFRTAAMLGLPSALALGDPAALLPATLGFTAASGTEIGFMPHFESAERGAWQIASEQAGMRLIDPRDPPLAVLQAIGRCRLLLSEALHGVIVADALRVPWIPIRPIIRLHRAKWQDWAGTMGLDLRFQPLPASSIREWAAASSLGSWPVTQRWLAGQDRCLDRITSERRIARAGRALRTAMRVAPQLSSAEALDRCQSRMLDAVQALSANPLRGADYKPSAHARAGGLQLSTETAYQLRSIG